MLRSDWDTVFPGDKQFNHYLLRCVADKLEWRKVDSVIVDQAYAKEAQSCDHMRRYT